MPPQRALDTLKAARLPVSEKNNLILADLTHEEASVLTSLKYRLEQSGFSDEQISNLEKGEDSGGIFW